MEIKGAIFDLDGTLIDSLMFWDIMWEEIGTRYLGKNGFRPSDEDDRAVRTMTMNEAMLFIKSAYNIKADGEELFKLADQMINDFYTNTVRPKKGVIGFLEYCRKKGVKMCIASATDMKHIKVAVKTCGLEKYFPKIFSCGEIGKGKNKPDIYEMALEYLETGKDDTYVFEDSCTALQTAANIGLKTVGIFDKYNYAHDTMKKISTFYIDDGETLEKLTDENSSLYF